MFALPALLFHKVATTPFARLTDWTVYVGYEGACVLLYFLVLAAARWVLRRTLREAAILAFAASWGNVGYMGVPLLSAAYGESAGLPAVLDTLVLQSLTILLLESGGAAGHGGLRTVGQAVVRNPLIIAVFAGAVVAGLRIDLPLPVVGFLSLLGPAAAGALFALGATLRGGALSEDASLVGGVLAAKLLLLPALAWLGLQFVPVPTDLQAPLVITTALPTAASVFVIAQRYGVLERPAAAIVFGSHLLGIITLTGLLVLLGS